MYLKDEVHYFNLYDLLTIEDCLRAEERYFKELESLSKSSKDRSVNGKKAALRLVHDLELYYRKGESYRNKRSAIEKLMAGDRERDEKLQNTFPPKHIYCPDCDELMTAVSKDLYDFTNEPMRVLFFFGCPSCKKRRGVFDNGEEYQSRESPCPKCRKPLKSSRARKGNVIVSTQACSSCGHSETDTWDLDKKDNSYKEKKEHEQKLLLKYRRKYCLTDEEGQKYIISTEKVKRFAEMFKKEEQKQKDPNYQKALKLKKLKVMELEKLIKKTLEKGKYIKLEFDKPEIGRHVIVPFTVQDADSAREEYDSENELKKLIRKTLADTNWRLMSEGVSYRLGFLYGRLKGYEGEKDLVQLVKIGAKIKNESLNASTKNQD